MGRFLKNLAKVALVAVAVVLVGFASEIMNDYQREAFQVVVERMF